MESTICSILSLLLLLNASTISKTSTLPSEFKSKGLESLYFVKNASALPAFVSPSKSPKV